MDSEHHHTKKNSSTQTTLIAVMAIIIVILAGSTFYFYHKYKQASAAAEAHPGYGTMGDPAPSGMMMKAMPTPTLTAQQTTEISAGPNKNSTQKTFDINGGNFYFTPNRITVNKGDTVTIVFHNDGGTHNFMIDQFNVKTDTTRGGNTTTVSFTADKTGNFEYYCSIGRHKKMGMWGTLTVQ